MRKTFSGLLLMTLLLSACGPFFAPTPDFSGNTPAPRPAQSLPEQPLDDNTLLHWERQGGFAGFCDSLDILRDGSFTLLDCKGRRVDGRLSESQAELLAFYDARLAPFAREDGDPAVADAMSLRLVFHGTGAKEASLDEQLAIAGLVSEVVALAQANERPDPQRQAAQQVLADFLAALNGGDFVGAAKWYGADTSMLEAWNPDAKGNLPVLLENACTRNGLQCLPVRSIQYRGPDERGGYQFRVEFTAPDGSLFHQGPCCGDESEGPFAASFVFSVLKSGENWLVMDLPPYMP
jgi:hypothetical protein